jgi:hypothetical protein
MDEWTGIRQRGMQEDRQVARYMCIYIYIYTNRHIDIYICVYTYINTYLDRETRGYIDI